MAAPNPAFFGCRRAGSGVPSARYCELTMVWSVGHGWFNDGDVYMPITPMFHVHAWGFPYIATMLGVKQVYCGRYVLDSVVALFQREKVTLSHCVQTILRMLLDSAKTTGINLSGWKMIIGGAILPQALAQEALRSHAENE